MKLRRRALRRQKSSSFRFLFSYLRLLLVLSPYGFSTRLCYSDLLLETKVKVSLVWKPFLGVLILLLITLSYSSCTSGRMYSFQGLLLGQSCTLLALSICSRSIASMVCCTLRMVWGLHQPVLLFFSPIFIPSMPNYYYYYLKRHSPFQSIPQPANPFRSRLSTCLVHGGSGPRSCACRGSCPRTASGGRRQSGSCRVQASPCYGPLPAYLRFFTLTDSVGSCYPLSSCSSPSRSPGIPRPVAPCSPSPATCQGWPSRPLCSTPLLLHPDWPLHSPSSRCSRPR